MRFGFRCRIAVAKKRKLLAARGISRVRASESGLPVYDRFGPCEFFQIALDQLGDTEQKFRSLCRGFFRPINKRLLCRRDGGFDVARVAIRDLRIGFASRRLDIGKVLPGDWLCELTVDEVGSAVIPCARESLNAQPAFANQASRKATASGETTG